jgi:hypothetical protein
MCHLVHFAMVAKMFVTWFVSKFIHWLYVGPLAKSVPNNPNIPNNSGGLVFWEPTQSRSLEKESREVGRARILETYPKRLPLTLLTLGKPRLTEDQ